MDKYNNGRDSLKRKLERAVTATTTMPDSETSRKLAEFYSAFADKTRVRIISALQAAGELAVSEVARIVGVSESAISHQLKLLRLLRLVSSRNEGRNVIYRLDDQHIDSILSAGLAHVQEN